MNEKRDQVRAAGRGGLALSLAKVYFMFLGLGQQIVLSWMLQESYGALRGALSPASITYNAAVSASVFGMSRAVSTAAPEDRARVVRSGLWVHLAIAVALGVGFFVSAYPLGWLLNSPYLVPMFQVLSAVVGSYALYAAFIGVLNGQRRFGAQALLDMGAATLRTLALIGGAYFLTRDGRLSSVQGAVWGFALMALVMTVIAALIVGVGERSNGKYSVRRHLQFVLPVMAAQALLNLLLQADTNTLRAFATRAAERAGFAADRADVFVGAYNAGQLFAFLPYQLLAGLGFVLFPLLSRAAASGDREAVARVVNGGSRVAVILIGLVVSVTASIPEDLMRLVFPPQFALLGAGSLRYLALGLAALAVYGVFCAILNGLERQWIVFGLTALGLALVFAGNWAFVAGVEFQQELLTHTALSTSVAVWVVAVVAGYVVHRETGGGVRWLSLVRVSAAVTVLSLAAAALPALGKVTTVAVAVSLTMLYVGLLIAMRELSKTDWAAVQAVVRRQKSP